MLHRSSPLASRGRVSPIALSPRTSQLLPRLRNLGGGLGGARQPCFTCSASPIGLFPSDSAPGDKDQQGDSGAPLPAPTSPQQNTSAKNHLWFLGGAVLLLCVWNLAPALASHVMAQPAPAAAVASISTASFGDIAMERLIYLVGKMSSLNLATKVLLVMLSTLPFSLFLGAVHSAITNLEFKQSSIKMYALLNKLPGAAVLGEKSAAASLLVMFAFICGTFIFAVLLGVVTDEIKTTFKNFRNGKYVVAQDHHLVILNWNQQTIPLLRQIAAAKKAGLSPLFNRPVALLAEVPKVEMDARLRKHLKGLDLEVLTRNGNPCVPADLASVAAANAASIIVLTPETSSHSSYLAGSTPAQAALALSAASPALARQTVVFQSPQSQTQGDHVVAFKRLTGLKDSLIDLHYSDVVTRMTAISAVQPGMQRVMQRILGQAMLQVVEVPDSLLGYTYQHARRIFADGVLCGIMRGKDVDFLVPETEVVRSTDKLVVLAPTPGVEPNAKAEAVFLRAAEGVERRLATHGGYKQTPRHIIVISPDAERTLELVDVLSELAPRGSSVTFLMPKALTGNTPARKGQCTFKYLTGPSQNWVTGSLLKDAGIEACTAVMVTSLETFSPDETDAFVTATLLQVQDSVRSSNRQDAPHFVAHVRHTSTQSSITAFLNMLKDQAPKGAGQIITKPDLFVADNVQAAYLAHTAATPHFAHLVKDILDAEGAEVYFRNPAVFNLKTGDLLTFADVAETARAFNETAIGVIRADGNFTLAPEPTYPLNLQTGDKIIVLAEEHDTAKMKRA